MQKKQPLKSKNTILKSIRYPIHLLEDLSLIARKRGVTLTSLLVKGGEKIVAEEKAS